MNGKERMRQLQQLIQQTIAALTVLDADALDRIKPEIEALTAAQLSTGDDLVTAMLAHRLLGRLLQETERNLRLFRITSSWVEQVAGAGSYGAFPEALNAVTRG